MRLNPHLHILFLDGAYHEEDDELVWEQLRHLQTREVGEVLERALRRMARHLRRRGLLDLAEDDDDGRGGVDPEANLVASAVSGKTPPAGPQGLRGLPPLAPSALAYERPSAPRSTASPCTQPRAQALSISKAARLYSATSCARRSRRPRNPPRRPRPAAIRGKRDAFVSHLDIAPTVLDLLGLWDAPGMQPFRSKRMGNPLTRPALTTEPIPMSNVSWSWEYRYPNCGVMQGPLKIVARHTDSRFHCFDVLADPAELKDLGEVGCPALSPTEPLIWCIREGQRTIAPC